MSDLSSKIASTRKEVEHLKDAIAKTKSAADDTTLDEVAKDIALAGKRPLKPRRLLKGHFGKIYAMQWAEDKKHLVSASQDGKLIVWNADTQNKVHAIPLRSSWVMTCAFSPGGTLVASGGLDNLCSIYQISQADTASRPMRELSAHTGYLSCCRFISDEQILTSSGDMACILWDLQTGSIVKKFDDHTGDVMSVSVTTADKNVFISGGCDSSCKLWDIRTGRCMKTFTGHTSDVNAVSFFPNGNAFATASDDSSCKLFDIRAYKDLKTYNAGTNSGVTSIEFSLSGKFLFAGYDDFTCGVWDTLKGERVDTLTGHENRISSVGVTRDGMGVCTGSWDSTLKVWA